MIRRIEIVLSPETAAEFKRAVDKLESQQKKQWHLVDVQYESEKDEQGEAKHVGVFLIQYP